MLSGSFERSVRSGTDDLHAERHLVLRDARADLRIAVSLLGDLVQLGEAVEHARAASCVDAGRIREIEHRIAATRESARPGIWKAESRWPTDA